MPCNFKRYGLTVSFNLKRKTGVITHYMTICDSLMSFTWILIDSYFEDANLERIFTPGYMPTNTDILHCTSKTTGIIEAVLRLGQVSYRYIPSGYG